MVLYHATRRVILVADVVVHVLLWHLNEDDVGNTVSYLEAAEFKDWPVITEFTEEPVCRIRESLHVVWSAPFSGGICASFFNSIR